VFRNGGSPSKNIHQEMTAESLALELLIHRHETQIQSGEGNIILEIVVFIGIRQFGDAVGSELQCVIADYIRGAVQMSAEHSMFTALNGLPSFVF
jgi:hypothetical protein